MFTSIEFWGGVAVALVLHNVTRARLQNLVLLAVSTLIYGTLEPRFLALLWLVSAVNFVIGHHLRGQQRRLFLWTGILTDLIILGFFKFSALWNPMVTGISNAVGISGTVVQVLLPLGLSFYLFRALSYLIDVYHQRLEPSVDWIEFALYIAFFAQIAAGPIERAGTFFQHLRQTRRLDQERFIVGLTCIFIGLYYKVAVADPLGSSAHD